MADPKLEKAYALLEKKRLANIAKNVGEGRTMNMAGIPLNEKQSTAGTLSEVMDTLRNKGKTITNVSKEVKTTPKDMMGINPEVAYKSRFFNLDKKLGGAGEALEDIGNVAREEGGLVKNQGGFAKVLPALGLGAAALGALGIANKVQAGEFGQAGLEGADLATDYVPVLGQVKAAIRPSELGNSELPPEEMAAREVYNQQMRTNKSGEAANYPATQQPLITPEDRVKYEDMKKQFSGISNRMK